jgi:hypothetical protein
LFTTREAEEAQEVAMSFSCPNCGAQIKVAGFSFKKEISAEGKSENKPLVCHLCDHSFVPEPPKTASAEEQN